MGKSSKEYMSKYLKGYKANRRAQWLLDNGPCAWCGSWIDLVVDHIDPATKEIHTANIWQVNEGARQRELAKCQVLCTDCHKKKTAIEASNRVQHGTLHMYNSPTYKCRCEACVLAFSNYQKAYRARKKAQASDLS